MQTIRSLRALCHSLYSGADPAHDISHVIRVSRHCERIGPEVGADMEVLLAAALLHDVGCTPKHLGKDADSECRSLQIAVGVLSDVGITGKSAERIIDCIRTHSYSSGLEPDSKEAAVLQDADRLDAMGAIGIARTFLVSGALGRPVYDIRDPLGNEREADDRAFGLDHFEKKLLKLRDRMHTEPARRIATERHERLVRFRREIVEEIDGRS